MNYWLDLFTGTTWEDFIKNEAKVSGFSERRRKLCEKIKPGDILLCYITGIMRWVGALQVIGSSNDTSDIWSQGEYPVRFDIKPIVLLTPEQGVPMEKLEGKVYFYKGPEDRKKYKGMVRGSPNLFKVVEDGKKILSMLEEAKKNPITEPYDEKKFRRKPTYKVESKQDGIIKTVEVTVPEKEDIKVKVAKTPEERQEREHSKIQYLLLKLGSDMGLDVWIARNDKSILEENSRFEKIQNVLTKLPTTFNEVTQKTIELIDVIWFNNNSIEAAFEIESTTSIYSGLLRMSDLVSLQPNLEINLFLVAPEDRRDKVAQEIRRPTFSLLKKPLNEICGFLSFKTLIDKIDEIKKLNIKLNNFKPDFLKDLAEYFLPT